MGNIGVQIFEDELALYGSRLAGYANTCFTSARWGLIQPGGVGAYDWTAFDAEIDAFVAAGLTPCVHIQAWIGAGPHYPDDEGAYTAWVVALVNRYKDRVTRWSIENEACAATWLGTAKQYADLLALAYQKIKDEDANAIILESTFTFSDLAILEAKALHNAGEDLLATELLDYVELWGLGTLGDYLDNLDAWFLTDIPVNTLSYLDKVYAARAFFDNLQVHWYGPGAWLPSCLANYVTTLYGDLKPWELWEVGSYNYVNAPFTAALLARYTAQQILSGVGLGAQTIIYLPYVGRAVPGVPFRSHLGLIQSDGVPRQAETTYRRVVTALDDYTSASAVAVSGVVAYKFIGRGRGDLYAVWTTTGTAIASVPIGLATAMVVNVVTGAMSFENPASLAVSQDPLLVQAVPRVGVRN